MTRHPLDMTFAELLDFVKLHRPVFRPKPDNLSDRTYWLFRMGAFLMGLQSGAGNRADRKRAEKHLERARREVRAAPDLAVLIEHFGDDVQVMLGTPDFKVVRA